MRINLPFPTLGGKQLWADLFYRAGWRIQRHCLTGHFRLLDPWDVRRAWGDYGACRRALPDAMPAAATLTLLVHGLGRSKDSLRPLARAFEAAGRPAAAVNYPSTRCSIEAHARGLSRLLASLDRRIEQVDFVTHSMGGLVVRTLLADRAATWRRRLRVGRVLMLFPPNQGAALADRWERCWLFGALLGPAARELTTRAAAALPGLDERFAVIAGDIGDGTGDGTVRIEETWLAGAEDWIVLPAGHTLGMRDRQVIEQSLRYLESGRFSPTARAPLARRRPASRSVPA